MSNLANLSLEEMKGYVDALDAEFQAAVVQGNILEVTVAKKDAVVSVEWPTENGVP